MPLLTFQLYENQQKPYQTLVARIDYGCEHGTICLIGDFQSGKTSLLKHLLTEKFDNPADYYVNLNRYLLDELDKAASAKAKIRLLMQIAIEDLLERHFQTHNLLVLDAIEVTYPYELNLVSITNRFACNGKLCIVSTPESKQHHYGFDFSWELAEVIRIT